MGVAAFAPDGTLWVGDGGKLKTAAGDVVAEFGSITGLAFQGDRVLVVDQAAKKLHAYTADKGVDLVAEGFRAPVGVAAGDSVYVKEGKGTYREIPPVWKVEDGRPLPFVEGR